MAKTVSMAISVAGAVARVGVFLGGARRKANRLANIRLAAIVAARSGPAARRGRRSRLPSQGYGPPYATHRRDAADPPARREWPRPPAAPRARLRVHLPRTV